MPIRSGGTAPYGPPAAVLAVIKGFRDRGLATPFTPDVLLRAGVADSIAPRTLKSLEGLELIDKDGMPTQQMEGLRRATTEDYPARLEEVVRSVYAEVFQFADPAKDDATRIADAFRAYEPAGQRTRMVTLFMGLCEAAGIVKSGRPANASPPRSRDVSAPLAAKRAAKFPRTDRTTAPQHTGGLPAALTGLLSSLPPNGTGWTQAQRDRFMTAFGSVLDYTVPIVPVPSTASDADDDPDGVNP
jgi:Family of unknown function (DUF5343)